MKKIFALVLALSMFCVLASAATIEPLYSVNMDDLNDCIVRAEFMVEDDVTDTEIDAVIFDEMRYDAVEVSQLAVGDIIVTETGDVEVETLVAQEGGYDINGGFEDGGVTLYADEGGTYISMDYEYTCIQPVGDAKLTLADEVKFSYWHEDELGGIAEDMIEYVVPASELKQTILDADYDTCVADDCYVTIENGLVTEITIVYMP